VQATLDDLHAAIRTLIDHDTERMTKDQDVRYQQMCAWAAPIASLLGDEALSHQLQVAALRCHSCIKEAAA
jgi:hypothetical protein